ncbi:MAG: phenylalanine--tRNA ligase subunit beta [Chloroflexota bacterium]
MKISLKWLCDYIDLNLPPEEIANRLTMAGNEVGSVQVVGGWQNIVVGEITAVNPHPNADRLRLATVKTGAGEETVVCGAPNLYVGDKIAFARVDAELFDGHSGERFKLKPAKIRGVVSAGMVCSEKELGLSGEHEGILVLPKDAPLGTKLAEYLGDTILDLEITPNRPDCLSVIGIARELVALTGEKLHVPEVTYPENGVAIDKEVRVSIADSDLCPRYSASLVTGVKVGESPDWLKARLTASGMRPINNIVDITNYVMLEYGQPLHAFDYHKLAGKEIIVRRARDGESIVSLDGVTRALAPDMLVIADRDKAVAIAGVMGGANSEVSEKTEAVLIESAHFKPTSIHYTARKLDLNSEASARFERGASEGLTVPALRRATQLLVELASGSAGKGIVDVYPGKKEPERVSLSLSKAKTVLGMPLSLETAASTLSALGFDCEANVHQEKVVATPPYWRSDIHIEEDLIEELARVVGYDKIPLTTLGQELPRHHPEEAFSFKKRVRQNLLGQGFQEVMSFSLSNETTLSRVKSEVAPLRLTNPMTEDQTCLRTTLRAGLLTALADNRRFEEGGIRLFELGRVYLPHPDDLPEEPEMLSGILAGSRFDKSWHETGEQVDFYDAKGLVTGLLDEFGIVANFTESEDKSLSPGKQAQVMVAGSRVGVIGEVSSEVLTAFEISEPIYLFELNLGLVMPHTSREKRYQPLPRFPSVARDIALVLDEGITHEKVLGILNAFPLVNKVALFDVYSGKQVAQGKKSLAYRIIFQSPDHTLVDEEVNGVMDKMLKRLSEELGATLRG